VVSRGAADRVSKKEWREQGTYWISPLGGPEQKIKKSDAARGAPAWSEDGKFLVVAKYHPDEQAAPDAGALFLVPVETGLVVARRALDRL
jgi:hypothetical protein